MFVRDDRDSEGFLLTRLFHRHRAVVLDPQDYLVDYFPPPQRLCINPFKSVSCSIPGSKPRSSRTHSPFARYSFVVPTSSVVP